MANFDDLLVNNPIEEQTPPQLSKEEYAAKKKAEREDVFSLSDEAAQEVATVSGNFQSFLDLQARLDRYSAVNALLTFIQNPDASRLGDFDYWKGQNCSIRPGQTAIAILEPHPYTKEDGTPGTGYNVKKVFDISQVDARKLRTDPLPRYSERQILSALVSKYPMKIIGVDDLPEGNFGESTAHLGAMTDLDGSILVRKGMEFPETFRAVAYEMAGAELATEQELTPQQEFSAYSATYLLCKKYGADTQAFSFDNVPGMFDGLDAQEIKEELSQIRGAAENISSRMARQLEAQQKAAKNHDAR